MSTAFADIHVDWRNAALCREVDPEMFFPLKGDNAKAAKQVCRLCPAIDDCLEFALTTGQRDGVWGGLSEFERRALARKTTGAATK